MTIDKIIAAMRDKTIVWIDYYGRPLPERITAIYHDYKGRGIYTRTDEIQTPTRKINLKYYDSVWVTFRRYDNTWDYQITIPTVEIMDDKITIRSQNWLAEEHSITYRTDTLSVWKIEGIK